MLMDHGFSRVRPLEGGFDAWVTAGYQLEQFDLVAIRPAESPAASG